MTNFNDTIAAISTPIGKGGISVIRVSGKDTFKIVKNIFKSHNPIKQFEANKTYFGKIYAGEELIDQAVISIFRSPKSYTGEDIIEISCHGGNFVTRRILELVLSRGARHARKGEFTRRAFLNGKLDLTEAESVIDLIDAKTRKSQKAAIKRLEGKLYKGIESIINEIEHLRTEIELDIDFPEHSNEQTDYENIMEQIESVDKQISELIATADEGIILNEGYRIAIAGEPNAGKSSIFNKLIENERSIVTEIPGTTRDYIEEDISLQGYLIKLFDTAGLRDSRNEIEKSGIKKSFDVVKDAHLVLWIEDLSQDKKLSIPERIKCKDHLVLFNKSDLVSKIPPQINDFKNSLAVSAKTGANIENLKSKIVEQVDIGDYELSHGMISNARQLSAAKKCKHALQKAKKSSQEETGFEFIAFDLREASEHLEEIIGKITSKKIINNIFDRFCVGK